MKTSAEQQQTLIQALRTFSPAWFASEISEYKWQYPPHLRILDQTLMKVARKELKRVIINMPPRHGKSELVSKYFPAWYLGMFPDRKILLTSYEAQFAASWGRKVRDMLIDKGKEYFNIEIDSSSRSVSQFEIKDNSGAMYCVGAGGSITGKGADLLIIDDPVINDAEAHSSTIRDNVWEWFNSTAYTRLEPAGTIVIIMTRWHEDDLCGRLLKKQAENDRPTDVDEQWHIINLPAIADSNDILGRDRGEALWSSRFPLDRLMNIKNSIGSYWFSALYQQSPSPQGGGIFKRKNFKYFTDNPDCFILKDAVGSIISKDRCTVYAVVDLAVTVKSNSDYTVILVFCVDANRNIYVIDIIRERLEGADHLNLIQSVYDRHRPLIIGIESVQYQLSLIQSALRQGLPVSELRPDKDKLSRALPIAAKCETGSVYFKEAAHWLNCFESELLSFPNGAHDDQVDTFAYIDQLIRPISKGGPAGAKKADRSTGITKGF
ncbi:MAG: phage terminase large subunit [Candidatus Kapabacteria bacterium]|jgi:predicted phage terminase large subunit-like protein|nr:phage terminase large subunit [Candidatus Kapabacteria bacterium]